MKGKEKTVRIRIAQEWTAFDSGRLVTIVSAPRVIPVPQAPPRVAGLLLYEGRALPALWPADETDAPWRCAVILHAEEGGLIAYLAQEVDGDIDAEDARVDSIF